ncbi:alpha/beta fold hydrolase [Myxococcota bacterium]|nr:alpha/beta fold hydrolase [Myxococcota bacterium]
MSGPSERTVDVGGGPCRIWEKGEGEPLGVLHGLGGCPHWTPFLDELSRARRVVVPSLPGFPGSGDHHREIDGHLMWITTMLDLLDAAGLTGADIAAASIAGMLVADAAALSPGLARRLVLTAPFGLYDNDDPTANVFANTSEDGLALQTSHPERYAEAFAPPEDAEESAEFQLHQYRASEAAARIFWPFGERGLVKRLHRIRIPVLLLWGEEDRVVQPSYIKRFASGLAGSVETHIVPGAGHQVWIDDPSASAQAIQNFLKD